VQSVSDLMKDVSGVAVSKGANGSSSVSVRGIDQRMLRITVDGQRQGGSGNPLDSIPPEIVQSLEVTKTFTPDMEADAVGGVINVNTGGILIKDAYVQGRHQANYSTTAPHPGARNSLTLGQPFSLFADQHNASLLTTISFDDQFARRERLSTLREWTAQISPGPSAYAGLAIPVLTQPLIEATREHRQRTGLVFNADAKFDDVAVYLRTNLSRDWAHRVRNFNDTDPSSGTVLALTPTSGTFSGVNLSRRNQDQTARREALNTSLGAKSRVDNYDWDASLAYGQTHEWEPLTLDAAFLSADTYTASYDLGPDAYQPAFSLENESAPGNTSHATDPSQYRFDYLYLTHNELHEQDGSGKFNLKITLDNGINYLKFGGKAQQRHRNADTDRDIYDASSQGLDMSGVVGSSSIDMNTLNYQFGPVPNAAAVAHLLGSNSAAFQRNLTQATINSTSGDTRVIETLWALYGMGKFMIHQWTILGGVRIEGTHISSSGNAMQLDNSGQFAGFSGINAGNQYVEVLPGLHLRYEPKVGLLYRGSITRSMSRPNSADIAPFRTLSFIDHRSRVGAPDLKPYLSTNFDWSVDKYSEAYGLTSFALFYKKIDHFITDAQYPVTIGNLGEFTEFKRINGDTAFATGAELSWQSPTWSLPMKLGKGSVEANYNFNHGEAHHAGRSGEVFPLPRQVDNQVSLKFHEIRGPLSLDTSVTYRSGWWEDLIARGFDNYITSAWDAEISGAYKIGKNTRITAGASNLFNQPTKHYAGVPSRMNDWQRNGLEMNLGVQWKM
jgi:TonB-dependent receptor